VLGLRLSGAQVTRVKAELDRYIDANKEMETVAHECGVGCSDDCVREDDIVGFTVRHPTQVEVEDLVERIIEVL